MERVKTLLQKLHKQFDEGANPSQLLLTTQMLQQELLHLQNSNETTVPNMVAVHMPTEAMPALPVEMEKNAQPLEEEKTIEVLQVDEAAIEAELEEIKRNAEAVQRMSVQNRTQLVFDAVEEDVPTLVHQHTNKKTSTKETMLPVAKEEPVSVNERLKEQKTELSERLNEAPVKDLKRAIGINDRFVYINELFRGDEVMYERSIKTINSFSIWPEAEYWIRRELKIKLGWHDDQDIVKQFDQLVKRRFT